jgi:hypothetical protein
MFNKYNTYSLAIELRPEIDGGSFIISPTQIIPCGEEILNGIITGIIFY